MNPQLRAWCSPTPLPLPLGMVVVDWGRPHEGRRLLGGDTETDRTGLVFAVEYVVVLRYFVWFRVTNGQVETGRLLAQY